jgi:hypothetical protein
MVAAVTDLLRSFFISAVGLRLLASIDEMDDIRARLTARLVPGLRESPVWAGWSTEAGRLWACGTYDYAQSQRVRAHVLLIEWWLPPQVHPPAWWRCDPKRPREWTGGRGG